MVAFLEQCFLNMTKESQQVKTRDEVQLRVLAICSLVNHPLFFFRVNLLVLATTLVIRLMKRSYKWTPNPNSKENRFEILRFLKKKCLWESGIYERMIPRRCVNKGPCSNWPAQTPPPSPPVPPYHPFSTFRVPQWVPRSGQKAWPHRGVEASWA